MLKCVTILNVLLLAVGTEAFGQDQSPPSDVPKNSRDLGLRGYGRNDISCLEWSDSCVTCRRDQPSAEYSCSNIGIACQPKNVQCLRRGEEPARPK